MKTITRESAIEQLLESRIDTCMADAFYLPSILEHGCKGFRNLTDNELIEEWSYEFDEDIKIK